MDKDRWAKIAIEMQEHINALEKIAKREQLDIVSIALYGEAEDGYSLETSMSYIEGDDVYNCDRHDDGEAKISLNSDIYKTYLRA